MSEKLSKPNTLAVRNQELRRKSISSYGGGTNFI